MIGDELNRQALSNYGAATSLADQLAFAGGADVILRTRPGVARRSAATSPGSRLWGPDPDVPNA